MSNIHNYKLDLSLYPFLEKLKKKELQETLELIFSTGYETMFPSNIISTPLISKINTLESTLEKLIGISSSKKGAIAELALESHITSRYGDISYTDMSQENHSGDAMIKFDTNDTMIMLESKNYTNKVNKDELNKMKFDMISCNIRWGIFISWNSNIIDKKEFDIEIFHEKGIQYYIVYISNLSSDIDRLDLAIQLIRKLIHHTDNKLLDKNINWIYSMIQNDIDHLNSIVTKNYQLRIWFEDMEHSMNLQLNKFYNKLRDYMYEMDHLIKDIIDKIANTSSTSIEINHSLYNLYLEKYKDNKKLFPVLSKLLDMFKEYKIIINEDDIFYKEDNIGTIKVMGKKITIYWNKFKHISELNYDNNIESFNMIKLLCSSEST